MKNASGWVAALLVIGGLAGILVASGDTKNSNDDLQKTEGTWTLISGEVNGLPIPEEVLEASKLTIDGDQFTVELGDEGVKKGIQSLDSTTLPKQINAHDTDGPTVGLNLGIYEFTPEGDYRVCFAATGNARPTEFVSTPENGQFIHVWRRSTDR